jgi:hypothetical protein
MQHFLIARDFIPSSLLNIRIALPELESRWVELALATIHTLIVSAFKTLSMAQDLAATIHCLALVSMLSFGGLIERHGWRAAAKLPAQLFHALLVSV